MDTISYVTLVVALARVGVLTKTRKLMLKPAPRPSVDPVALLAAHLVILLLIHTLE